MNKKYLVCLGLMALILTVSGCISSDEFCQTHGYDYSTMDRGGHEYCEKVVNGTTEVRSVLYLGPGRYTFEATVEGS